MRDTSNTCIDHVYTVMAARSLIIQTNNYSIRVQWPKAVDVQ